MFGIGIQELAIIFVVALLIFGPKRLPEFARSLGKGLAEFRRASSDLRQSFNLDLDAPPPPRVEEDPRTSEKEPERPAQAVDTFTKENGAGDSEEEGEEEQAPKAPNQVPATVPDEPAPITEHLAELRKRLFWILATLLLFTAVAFSFAEQIFLFLLEPVVEVMQARGSKLQAISPTETFFTYLKAALLAGFMASLPVTFWQLWAFVSPGLYAQERRAVIPFVVVSSLLFAGGAIFGYTQVFPLVFEFLSGFDTSGLIEQSWTMSLAFSTTARLFLAFGVAFELPILIFFLAITGIVSARKLWAGTPYAVLGIFVTAAVLTPPDFVSQVLLAIPMLILYLLGVGVAWLFDPERRRQRHEAGEDESSSGDSESEDPSA